jgi:hypothetical protein
MPAIVIEGAWYWGSCSRTLGSGTMSGSSSFVQASEPPPRGRIQATAVPISNTAGCAPFKMSVAESSMLKGGELARSLHINVELLNEADTTKLKATVHETKNNVTHIKNRRNGCKKGSALLPSSVSRRMIRAHDQERAKNQPTIMERTKMLNHTSRPSQLCRQEHISDKKPITHIYVEMNIFKRAYAPICTQTHKRAQTYKYKHARTYTYTYTYTNTHKRAKPSVTHQAKAKLLQ